MYAQPTHHDSSEIDQQIYNFKSKLKNELKNFEGNVDPYLDAIKLIVNGEILSDDDESYADSLYNFESGKSQVLISKAFSNAMIKRQNISIILFNENSFAKVPIESSVLLNKTKIIFVHDLREETLNKIRKFDKNISSRYTARKKNELKFYELQNISMKENSQ